MNINRFILLVNILILSQEEEAFKKTEELLRAQNKVAFVTILKRNTIIAYDNKISTDSSAFLDAESKV